MNLRNWLRGASALVFISASTLVAVGVISIGTPQAAHASSSIAGGITRSEVLARARDWYNRRYDSDLTYSQTSYTWDMGHTRLYRRDCSGYVGMAWHLNADPWTGNIEGYGVAINRNDLRAGDLLNDEVDGHAILFEAWESDHYHFSYYSFGHTPIVHGTGATFSGTLAGWPAGNYQAFRYKNIIDDAPTLGILDFTLSDSLSSSLATRPVVHYGNSPMVPIAGDWDGNGTVTPSAYDPTTGKFYISNTPETGAATWVFMYGDPYAVPVVGDWDGDGKDNVGVRMGNTFFLRTSPVTSGTETTTTVAYGDSPDAPLIGDWDGDGKDNVGVYKPALGKFYLRMTANTDPTEATTSIAYGNPYSLPLVGDWNGDHRDNIGVRMGLTDYFRTSEVNNPAEITSSVAYGNGFNEWPLIGDWNGDGIDTQGIVF